LDVNSSLIFSFGIVGVIVVSMLMNPVFASTDVLGVGFPPQWDCPPTNPIGTQMPAPNPQGHRLLTHVIDKDGDNIDIWCMNDGGGSGHIEIMVSSLAGSKSIANCTLAAGNNLIHVNATHHYANKFQIMPNFTNTGGLIINVDDLHWANHTNYVETKNRGANNPDSNKDTHTFYNFTSGKAFKKLTTNHYDPELRQIVTDTSTPWQEISLSEWAELKPQEIQFVLYGENHAFAASLGCVANFDDEGPQFDYVVYNTLLPDLQKNTLDDFVYLLFGISIVSIIIIGYFLYRRR